MHPAEVVAEMAPLMQEYVKCASDDKYNYMERRLVDMGFARGSIENYYWLRRQYGSHPDIVRAEILVPVNTGQFIAFTNYFSRAEMETVMEAFVQLSSFVRGMMANLDTLAEYEAAWSSEDFDSLLLPMPSFHDRLFVDFANWVVRYKQIEVDLFKDLEEGEAPFHYEGPPSQTMVECSLYPRACTRAYMRRAYDYVQAVERDSFLGMKRFRQGLEKKRFGVYREIGEGL